MEDFNVEVFLKLCSIKPDIIFCPLSLTKLLMILNIGTGGKTLKQFVERCFKNAEPKEVLNRILKLENQSESFKLQISTLIFVDDSIEIRDGYIQNIKEYNSELKRLNFLDPETKNKINEWISKMTNNKIKSIDLGNIQLKPFIPVNVVYLYANWKKKFSIENTKIDKFRSLNGEINVPMMNMKSFFKYKETYDHRFISIPYVETNNGNFSCYIILPKKDMELKLTPEIIKECNLYNSQGLEINLFLPKFEIENEFELGNVLSDLGLSELFSQHGDFSGIFSDEMLYIDRMIQKVYLKIDENGTEAAAVTAGARFSGPSNTITFKVNQPFGLVIKENTTNQLLFMSQVNTLPEVKNLCGHNPFPMGLFSSSKPNDGSLFGQSTSNSPGLFSSSKPNDGSLFGQSTSNSPFKNVLFPSEKLSSKVPDNPSGSAGVFTLRIKKFNLLNHNVKDVTEEDITLLQNVVIAKIINGKYETVPIFIETVIFENTIRIKCKDLESKIWFNDNINGLEVDNSYYILIDELNSYTIRIKVKNINPNNALKLLKIQNPHFSTKMWSIQSFYRMSNDDLFLNINVDESSYIKFPEYDVYYGLNVIDISF